MLIQRLVTALVTAFVAGCMAIVLTACGGGGGQFWRRKSTAK